ncbi:hypothetical protein ELG63_36400 [Rhizobium leguminosarum]|uniref:hypothetical protein n=1 Tax=Rhizobium leguminosarum TaxID=384 RepID=UPI00103125D7|nr:hypothetical protein [Rhizobium leguminosarum]TBH28171.1 hypothetical protein ELG63_36400 [Rhizobium leguminosarum]
MGHQKKGLFPELNSSGFRGDGLSIRTWEAVDVVLTPTAVTVLTDAAVKPVPVAPLQAKDFKSAFIGSKLRSRIRTQAPPELTVGSNRKRDTEKQSNTDEFDSERHSVDLALIPKVVAKPPDQLHGNRRQSHNPFMVEQGRDHYSDQDKLTKVFVVPLFLIGHDRFPLSEYR